MIVVDASAFVASLLDHSVGTLSRNKLLHGAHAPHLIDLEVTNVLRRLVRLERVVPESALGALEQLRRAPLRRYRHTPLLARVWELRNQLSSYDACYVALAEALGVPLITADARLAAAGGVRCEIELIS